MAAIDRAISSYNELNPGSSRRVARLMVVVEPLSGDAGELSDKGTINQRAVRQHRSADIDQLYSDEPGVGTLRFPAPSTGDA